MKRVLIAALVLLVPASAQADALSPWLGTWGDGDNRIVLTRSGKQIRASGKAYWRANNPDANLGFFEGRTRPVGGVLTIRDEECVVTMKPDHGDLEVDDNNKCGGFNVTFRGTYNRPPVKQPPEEP